MRQVMRHAVVLWAGLMVWGGIAGCSWCCPPKEELLERRIPEPFKVDATPTPMPMPTPVVEQVEPEPTVAPVPPKVVAAVEDLDKKYPGLFVFDKDKGLFQFSSDTTFDSGSAVVRPEAEAALLKLAEILNDEQVGDRMLTIVGHTDTDRVIKPQTIAHLKGLGKTADNQGLSEARAEAVAAVLQTGGVDAGRMTTEGRGQTEPIADNRTVSGKAKNRRVSVYLTPMAK